MRKALFLVVTLLALDVSAQDAVKTDGDKYEIKFENDCVRVLEYHDLPGEKTISIDIPPLFFIRSPL